jgi:hypothetical protein
VFDSDPATVLSSRSELTIWVLLLSANDSVLLRKSVLVKPALGLFRLIISLVLRNSVELTFRLDRVLAEMPVPSRIVMALTAVPATLFSPEADGEPGDGAVLDGQAALTGVRDRGAGTVADDLEAGQVDGDGVRPDRQRVARADEVAGQVRLAITVDPQGGLAIAGVPGMSATRSAPPRRVRPSSA